MNLLVLLCFISSIYGKKIIEFNDDNFVSLRGDINEELSLKFIQEITILKSNTINIYINSDGGSVENGLEIINVIINLQYQDKIINCIANKAISMAFVILQACNNRYATPYATLMQHQASLGKLDGKIYDINKYIKFINNNILQMDELQSRKIEIDLYEFKNRITTDWWMSTQEAIKMNVVDSVGIIICKTIKKNCYYK
jgi:ATP-dependent protease ClpP protease subunit